MKPDSLSLALRVVRVTRPCLRHTPPAHPKLTDKQTIALAAVKEPGRHSSEQIIFQSVQDLVAATRIWSTAPSVQRRARK